MKEKGTSILIETKDQRKEEREKRGRNKRIGGRGINLTRDPNTRSGAGELNFYGVREKRGGRVVDLRI